MKYAENVDTPTHTTWKSNSSIFQLRPREKAALNYSQRLRDTYQNHPEVRRILKHRQIPKHIFRFFYFGDFFQNFFCQWTLFIVRLRSTKSSVSRRSEKRTTSDETPSARFPTLQNERNPLSNRVLTNEKKNRCYLLFSLLQERLHKLILHPFYLYR